MAVAVVAVSAAAAGGVVAATRSSDESALAPARQSADKSIERRVNRLLRRMTLDEKLQQIQLLSDGQVTKDGEIIPDDAREGSAASSAWSTR